MNRRDRIRCQAAQCQLSDAISTSRLPQHEDYPSVMCNSFHHIHFFLKPVHTGSRCSYSLTPSTANLPLSTCSPPQPTISVTRRYSRLCSRARSAAGDIRTTSAGLRPKSCVQARGCQSSFPARSEPVSVMRRPTWSTLENHDWILGRMLGRLP